MKCFRIPFVIVILTCSACAAVAQGMTMDWTVDGVQRTALVFATPPTSAAMERHPLIFAFHGHGGSSQSAARGMHLETMWPGAFVVYPQGLKTPSQVDPEGNFPGWQVRAGQSGLGDRDLKFFDAMLDTLTRRFPIDSARIYATGFSNGAIFSYLLWAERGKILGAFGICAGRLDQAEHLPLARAVLVIGGEADPILPFADQRQSIEIARHVDHATATGQPCGPICTLYPSTSQTPVVTRIHPGGHVYPPWAPEAIVEFFKTHPLQ
jgi:polyhydroxybutyrate depolymerase